MVMIMRPRILLYVVRGEGRVPEVPVTKPARINERTRKHIMPLRLCSAIDYSQHSLNLCGSRYINNSCTCMSPATPVPVSLVYCLPCRFQARIALSTFYTRCISVEIRPRKACNYPNLRYFGWVSYDKVSDLYSGRLGNRSEARASDLGSYPGLRWNRIKQRLYEGKESEYSPRTCSIGRRAGGTLCPRLQLHISLWNSEFILHKIGGPTTKAPVFTTL